MRRERRGRIALERHRVAILVRRCGNGGRRQRRLRQHGQQFVDADAQLRRNAHDRRERALPHGFAAEPIELFLRRHLAFEVFFHHCFVGFDDRLERRFAQRRRIDERAGRILRHIQRANDAFEIVPLADRHVEQHALRAEHFADRVDQAGKLMLSVSSFVMQRMRPKPGVARFLPRAPRVDLDAGVGVDRDQRRVDRPQSADRLADEIRVARRVDDVESFAGMIEVNDRRFDRMLVMLFFFVEVADAGAVIDAGLAAHGARLHQQMVDERGLARRAVSTNRDVANILDVSSHDRSTTNAVCF